MFDLNVDISSENYNNWCDTHPIIVIEKPELSRNPNDYSTELSVSGVSTTTSSIIINGLPPPPSDDRESHGHMQYSNIATTKLIDCKYDDSGFEDNSLQQQQGESVIVTRKLFPVDEISRGGGWKRPVVGSCEKGVGDSDDWLKLSVSTESKTTASSTNVGVYHYSSMMRPATALQPPKPQQVIRKSRRGPRSRSSQYRGVTFYRRTGRWESHIWDCGKQVYLGGFDTAHAAARAYDRAAIKFRGVDADINFYVADYEEDMNRTKDLSKEEFVRILRRQGTTFPRRSSSLSRHTNNTINREGAVTGTTWHKFGLQPQQQVHFVGTNTLNTEGKLAHLTNHGDGGIITSSDNLNLGISSAPVIAHGQHDCPAVPRHLICHHLHALSKYPTPGRGGRKTIAFHGLPTILPSCSSTSQQQPYHTFLSTREEEELPW